MRFTVGKNGALYAFCMKSPEAGQKVIIKSMGKKNLKKVRKVTLLGYNGKIKWCHSGDALEITAPTELPFKTAVTFRID